MVDRIILIANIKNAPNKGYSRHMSQFNFGKKITNELLANAIKKSGFKLIVYSTLKEFLNNISYHKNDLIFPYYHGVGSKFRQSYVQSICESYNLKYIGADAYAMTVANDKVLSKDLCRKIGIKSPSCKIFYSDSFPIDIELLKLPLIVKPQFEGDSIGISKKGIFDRYENALKYAKKLNQELNQPILIEEFLKGKEISACLIGHKETLKKINLVELVKRDSSVYSYKSKKTPHVYRNVNSLLSNDLYNKIHQVFSILDKVEFMRIDFIFNGEFRMIELTPDPSLSPLSCIFNSIHGELRYEEFIGYLIENCIERYNSLNRISL
ncbi:MAG: hypothetical protein JEY96_19875 [Bacteroidales bacterium]|nr:hypothetical protein [Bacteroidales bacterium]